MNRRLIRLCVAVVFPLRFATASDVIYLSNEQAIQCKIEAITDNIVTYITEVRLPNGQTGIAKRTIPASQVKFVDFGPIPGELDLIENLYSATAKEIDEIWDKKFGNLHRPRNNAGKIGIALGHALLRDDREFQWKRALDLFDLIREKAWDDESKKAARQGRLKSLIRLGEIETAIVEARALAAETEDATMLIEARYILAQADFSKLKKIEEENPKWEEDDDVRPERERLYHAVVDQLLWPYLFHGTLEEQAARGLVSAGQVYRFAKKEDEAKACFEDVLKLYPSTAYGERAKSLLENSEIPPNTNKPDNESDDNQ